ncbi:hypothetical protein WR25_25390 [Diploscapter pachys]|uniref:Uncharacterized protein n=1 Tax=Diploscapter pachys TaxID=2018661 RepID=A0A2A2JRP7_9BILA|nr:hypothetical protein WR25_25390 [Diploscapter pachys]
MATAPVTTTSPSTTTRFYPTLVTSRTTIKARDRQDVPFPDEDLWTSTKSTTHSKHRSAHLEEENSAEDINREFNEKAAKASEDAAILKEKCIKVAPLVRKVGLNLGTVDVKGIPYYPINEEGAVGVGVNANIPFGAWGGGFSSGVGVRDYWSQNMEAGANWVDGKYGYKNGWSVPLVQSLGVEGGQHNVVSFPLTGPRAHKLNVDNGYHVGSYFGINDHVGVDYKEGNVQHTFGVGVPLANTGFMTGQAVAFPGLDTSVPLSPSPCTDETLLGLDFHFLTTMVITPTSARRVVAAPTQISTRDQEQRSLPFSLCGTPFRHFGSSQVRPMYARVQLH